MTGTFQDAVGRNWRLAITVADLPRVRAAGFDLSRVYRDEAGFAALLDLDPELLGRVLWSLCESQALAASVTPEEFAAGFDGPTLTQAVDALADAVLDFRYRPAIARQLKARRAELTSELETLATRAMTTGISNANAGGSPASLASTPAP
jgi:hypothetical protein